MDRGRLVLTCNLQADQGPHAGSSAEQGCGCLCVTQRGHPHPQAALPSPQYYCCKKSRAEDADEEEEEEHGLPTHPRGPTCNACSSQAWMAEAAWRPSPANPAASRAGWRLATAPPAPHTLPLHTDG